MLAVHVLLYLVLICTLPSSAASNLLSVDIRPPAAQHADTSICLSLRTGRLSSSDWSINPNPAAPPLRWSEGSYYDNQN
jgi:hypothetical protein